MTTEQQEIDVMRFLIKNLRFFETDATYIIDDLAQFAQLILRDYELKK